MRLRFAAPWPLALVATGCIIQAPPASQPTPTVQPTPVPLASPSRSPSPAPTPRPSPSWDPSKQRPVMVSGRSDLALEGPYLLLAGERTFRCFYEGRAPIAVWLIRADGKTDAELFNRDGAFSDQTTHTITSTQNFHVQVTGANGPWRIEIQ